MTPSAATPKRSEAVEILRQARRIPTPGGVEELVADLQRLRGTAGDLARRGRGKPLPYLIVKEPFIVVA